MTKEGPELEMVEYQLLLIEPDTRKIYAADVFGEYLLPKVRIPAWRRPAEQLQIAIEARWAIHVVILDTLPEQGESHFCAIGEVLNTEVKTELSPVRIDQIAASDISDRHREAVECILSGLTGNPFSRIGWISEGSAWIETTTQQALMPSSTVRQYNIGDGFMLACFFACGGDSFWLKATGAPNAHEFELTRLLCKFGAAYLPRLLSTRSEWNAWIMSGGAKGIAVSPADFFQHFRSLEIAVDSLARLQMISEEYVPDLFRAGAFDQRLDVLHCNSGALFEFLRESMSLQTSVRVPRLEGRRLEVIQNTLFRVLCRLGALGLPVTLIHGDLNQGNILPADGRCQFIDWAEAYISNPLISLQHLLLHNKAVDPELRLHRDSLLRKKYLLAWSESRSVTAFETALQYMPLLAAVSALYGRGEWLNTRERYDTRRQAYGRSLARYMDRAVSTLELLETKCH